MKKIVLLLGLSLGTLSMMGQKKDVVKKNLVDEGQHPTEEKTTIPVPKPIPDSVATISVKDLQEFNTVLGKIPHDEYIKLTPEQVLGNLAYYIRERNKKKQ